MMSMRVLRVGVVVVALMHLHPWPSAADSFLLNFEDPILDMQRGVPIRQVYGDGPHHDVVYNSREAAGNTPTLFEPLEFWDVDYGDLVSHAYCGFCSDIPAFGVGEIAILPNPGYWVTLRSFDLAGWLRTDGISQYTVFDAAYNVLFSSGNIDVEGDSGHSHFTPNLISGNGLILQWGPDAYNVGLDNLAFDVTETRPLLDQVPEPASLLLVGTGLVLAARGWRSRCH